MGITVVVVTHQMEVIKQICGRIAIMENGQVLEIGETEEIFLKIQQVLENYLGRKYSSSRGNKCKNTIP